MLKVFNFKAECTNAFITITLTFKIYSSYDAPHIAAVLKLVAENDGTFQHSMNEERRQRIDITVSPETLLLLKLQGHIDFKNISTYYFGE